MSYTQDKKDSDRHVDEFGYTVDGYGVVHNSVETYRTVAYAVTRTPIVVAWTDEASTMLAVQFSLPQLVGPSVGGVLRGHLWVSVLGFGSYSFEPSGGYLDPSYVAEKLGGREAVNPTWVALAELLTGVCEALTRDAKEACV